MARTKAISVALAAVVAVSTIGLYFAHKQVHSQIITVYYGTDPKDNETFVAKGRCAITQNGDLYSVVFTEQDGTHREIHGATRVFVEDLK
jgi:hypothetical protein